MRLRSELQLALWDALVLDAQRIRADEPQLVANMVCRIPNRVNSLPPFAGGRLTVKSGGIFVHGQPQVNSRKFNPSHKSVEVGDLLLIRNERQYGGPPTAHSALLLQVKRYKRLLEKPYNKNQHYLYAQWPHFTYTSPSSLSTEPPRHVTGSNTYDGTKYLLIEEKVHHRTHVLNELGGIMTALPTQPSLSHHQHFLGELVDFVLGDAGRAFASPPPPATIDWDKVVEDLLEVTRNRGAAPMSRARTSGARDRREAFFFITGSFDQSSVFVEYDAQSDPYYSNFDDPPEIPVEREEEGGGIPTIEFTIDSRLEG